MASSASATERACAAKVLARNAMLCAPMAEVAAIVVLASLKDATAAARDATIAAWVALSWLSVAAVFATSACSEASVAVAVGSPHRGVAFDACEFAIDTLKARAPIWKRETYRDGGTAWIANTPS